MDQRRQTSLKMDLGGENVILKRVQLSEALSTPFAITLEVYSMLGELDLLPHLGKPVAISLTMEDTPQRYFHGLLVEGEYSEETNSGLIYTLQLKPWTYFLSRNRNFAIFQDLDAIEIIRKVLDDAKVSDFDVRMLGRGCAKRPYTVQYGESDFAFLSRLMEEEGIYYFFRHEKDCHVLVLCDGPRSHLASKPQRVVYNPLTGNFIGAAMMDRGREYRDNDLQAWTERVSSGAEAKVTVRDFDFEKPERPLEAIKNGPGRHPRDQAEVYQYPAKFVVDSQGEKLGGVILDSARAQRLVYRGKSQAVSLVCGTKVSVAEHPSSRFNGEFLIVSTAHTITGDLTRSGNEDTDEPDQIQFEAIPATTVWQAPRQTPRPVVHGLESAIVTGPDNEEIFTDEYGRVKVRFHWDRSKTSGEKSTCWMRVSQTGGLGNIILPRVGHEVLVDFLGGDPDRPVVVGRVFNKSHMPVYKLPANMTRAVWRTKTHGSKNTYGKALDTGSPGANELRFEDKGGEEEVLLHAEKDLNTRVRNKETHHVGQDQEILIRNDRKITVENNETGDIQKNRKFSIGVDDLLEVENNIKIKAGTNIEIEAGAKITLTVGSSKITIDPVSIKLESTMITVDAKATLEATSKMSTVKGTGILILNGGLVKIN